MNMRTITGIVLVFFVLSTLTGCTIILQKGRRSDIEKIGELSTEIDRLSQAKAALEDRLKAEIAAKEVSLSMEERGLVLTFVSEVLFDSGKAVIKTGAYQALDKVAQVLLSSAAGMNVGIEGHTDNQPIKFSKWGSNWELSGARALAVLNYLLEKGVEPTRLSFIGYGEFRPVDSNDTKEGRQKNRRVEVIILPAMTKKADSTELLEPKENLK